VRILFIRHARTQSNVLHLLDTAYPGPPLDEVGLQQAEDLVAKVAGEPIDVVMTSDILRARQTGEPLAKALGVPVITHPGVREISAGDWEMDADWSKYVDVIVQWPVDPTLSIPNGDNGVSFMTRFDAAIEELCDYECAVVVTHGAALRTWMVAQTNSQFAVHQGLGNTDVVIVEGVPGSWRLISWAGEDMSG